jgi:hypothetical protein
MEHIVNDEQVFSGVGVHATISSAKKYAVSDQQMFN